MLTTVRSRGRDSIGRLAEEALKPNSVDLPQLFVLKAVRISPSQVGLEGLDDRLVILNDQKYLSTAGWKVELARATLRTHLQEGTAIHN